MTDRSLMGCVVFSDDTADKINNKVQQRKVVSPASQPHHSAADLVPEN